MSKQTIHIKNMVCPRCITAVEQALGKLNIPFSLVELGKVEIDDSNNIDYPVLEKELNQLGFELIKDKNQLLVEKIKNIIIQHIYYDKSESQKVNFSKFIASELDYDYSHLSTVFSNTENITIEKYIILQKIEKVKELISYNNLSFSEIAYKINYSSVSHLSKQFKRITGLTLSEYKKLDNKERKSIESIS